MMAIAIGVMNVATYAATLLSARLLGPKAYGGFAAVTGLLLVVGVVMLGLGRALGETMAVTFVIGNAHRISSSVLLPGTTISASIANEFNEASGLHLSALMALALVLFLITFVILALARLLIGARSAA